MPDEYVAGKFQERNTHKPNYETVKPKKTSLKKRDTLSIDKESNWQNIFDSISDWIVLTDLEGNILKSNKAGEKFTNLTCTEIIGKSYNKLLHGSKRNIKNYLFDEKSDTCSKASTEILLPDGMWVEVIVEPIKDKDEKIGSFILVIRDISEKKQNEEVLHILEQENSNIFTLTNDAIIYLDSSGEIIDLNQKAIELIGSSKNEIVNRNFTELNKFSITDIPKYNQFFKSTLSGYKRTTTIQIKNKNNESLFLECRASMVKSNNNKSKVMYIIRNITPYKRTEKILKETDHRYRSFVQKSSGIAFRAKIDFTPVFFHGSVEAITGYNKEEFLFGDLRWYHIIHPDDLSVLSSENEKKLHTLPNYSNEREYRIICKDGQIKWIHEIIQNDVDTSGKIAFVQGMIYDITERKLAEDKLVESEKRLQMSMDAAQLGIWDWDFISGKMTWDGCHAELFGIEKDEFDGTIECFMKRIHPEDLPSIKKAVENARNNREGYLAEYRVIWPDGTIHWVLGRGRCVYDQDGNAIRMLGTIQDVTGRRNAEQELKKEHNLLRLLIDNIPDRIFVKDKNHSFILGNNAVVKHQGLKSEDELIGKTDFDLYPDHDAKIFYSEENEVIEQGKPIINKNLFYKDKNGREEWSLLTKVPLKELNGDIVGLVGIKRNITELKITQNKLEETQSFLKALINSVSDNLLLIDADEKIIVANEAFSKNFNMPLKEIIGKNVFSFLSEEVSNHRRKYTKQVFESGKPVVFYDKRNGLYFENRLYPVKNKDNIVKYIAIFGRDVTQQKNAEELLKESEQRFRNLFEQIPSGVALYKPVDDGEDFVFLDFNKAAEKIENVKKEDLLGKRVTEVFTGVKESGIFKQFHQVLRTGKTLYSPESLYKDERDSGTWRENWVYKLSTGYIVSFYNDITEKKLLEVEKELAVEQLKKSEEKFRGIYEQSPIAIEIYDSDGKLIDVNSETMELFGVKNKEDVIDFSLWEDPNFPDEHKERLKNGEVVFTSLTFDFAKVKDNKLYASSKSGTMDLDLYAIPLMDNREVTGYLIQIMDVTDRKKAEEKLKESQSRLEKAQEIGLIGAWNLDIVNNILEWTDQNYKIFGVEIGTPMNYEKFLAIVHPEDRNYVHEKWSAGMNGEDYDIEHRLLVNDEVKWVREKAYITFKDGKAVHAIGITQDITERKKAVEALAESETRFRRLFEEAPLGYQSLDENGCLIDINQEWLNLLGYSREEVIGRWFGDFLIDDQVELFRERFEIFKVIGKTSPDFYMKNQDGSINIVHFEGRIAYDENGQFKQTHCILYDVTHEREMEHELQKQVYLNRTLLDALPCVAMLLRPYSHEIIASNQAAIEVGAIPGEKCYHSWMKQGKECPWCVAPELWKTGKVKHREIEYMQKVWDAYWIPVSDDMYMHFAFDITKHKEIEEKLLIHQNKLKSLASELTKTEATQNRKIASCLHDSIGQALSLSIIQLKKLKRDLDTKRTQEIDNICGMIEDANETVRNLTFELASPTLEKLGLGPAIWELLNDLIVNHHDIEFKFNNKLEEISIKPNIKTLLYRSVRELIINVIKHAKAENLEVDINHENNIIQIIVCDDGVGFDSQNEEYYAQKDSGYGLFNIKEQIEYLGGSFKIFSQPGKGSKFLLTIPIEIIKD